VSNWREDDCHPDTKQGSIRFDVLSVAMNTFHVSITPKAIQDLLDELEASKQSRLRAWNVLQRLRLVLSEARNVAIPAQTQKTFDAEGEALEHALTKSFRLPISGRDHKGRMQTRLPPTLFRLCGKRWIERRI
jgi:hypothetical protein